MNSRICWLWYKALNIYENSQSNQNLEKTHTWLFWRGSGPTSRVGMESESSVRYTGRLDPARLNSAVPLPAVTVDSESSWWLSLASPDCKLPTSSDDTEPLWNDLNISAVFNKTPYKKVNKNKFIQCTFSYPHLCLL